MECGHPARLRFARRALRLLTPHYVRGGADPAMISPGRAAFGASCIGSPSRAILCETVCRARCARLTIGMPSGQSPSPSQICLRSIAPSRTSGYSRSQQRMLCSLLRNLERVIVPPAPQATQGVVETPHLRCFSTRPPALRTGLTSDMPSGQSPIRHSSYQLLDYAMMKTIA